MRTKHSLLKIANLFGFYRSGFYKWEKKPVSKREKENEVLKTEIYSIYEKSRKTYGSPRITAELSEKGMKSSVKRTAKLMKEMNLKARAAKKFRRKIDVSQSKSNASRNLLNREFRVCRANQVWASDITYIRTSEGWLYFCVVIDLFSRKVVGAFALLM